MRKSVFIIFITTFVCACSSTKQPSKDNNMADEKFVASDFFEKQTRGVDFCAFGENPMWEVEVDFEKEVRFKSQSISKEVIIPASELLEMDDSLVVKYKWENKRDEITLKIEKRKNLFHLQEGEKPYKVTLIYEKGNKPEQIFNGQGEYFADVKLHRKWMLQEINGKNVSEYQNTNPAFMDFYLNDGRVGGLLGCNNFGGSVVFGRNKLLFSHMMSTKKACFNVTTEDDFANALHEQEFSYSINENVLVLQGGENELKFVMADVE